VVQTRAVSLAPILAINFIGTLGFSLVLPFLVFLVTDWGGNALVYGLTGATYSVFQLIGAPMLGRWSDRVGRRRVLLVSQTGTLLFWLIFLGAFALPRIELLEVDTAFTWRARVG
jgi:DHA1 family tetracycline resistance protein-like MFS transporter